MPKYIPNLLSTFRLMLVPLFAFAYFRISPTESKLLPLAIYVIATVTDVIDGYIARRYNLITKIGTVLDPLADKLMLLTALGCLYFDGKIPRLFIALIVAKECFMILAGTYLYFSKEKLVIPANHLGKLATILFFAAVLSLLTNSPQLLQNLLLTSAILVTFIALSSYLKVYRQNKKPFIR